MKIKVNYESSESNVVVKRRLNSDELELLKQCDGRHKSIDAIFTCVSCDLLFKENII